MMMNGFVTRIQDEGEFICSVQRHMGNAFTNSDAYDFAAFIRDQMNIDLQDRSGDWLAFWELFENNDFSLLIDDWIKSRK